MATKEELQARLDRIKQTNEMMTAWLNRREMVTQNSTLTRRAEAARGLGKSFGGARDLYTALGYPIDPDYTDFFNIYDRDGLGTRVVDAVSDETWSEHPILYTGNKAPDEDTPGALGEQFNNFANEFDLWAKFNELDTNTGCSRFSILFLGLPGQPEEPVEPNTKQKLTYISVHDEGDAEVDEATVVKDPESPRFGLPDYYYVIIDATTRHKIRVHHSRILHYKEGRQRTGYGRVYGVPRLRNIINRFLDLEKVVGGGSEAFWLLIRKGMALVAREGMTLPQEGTAEYEALEDEVEEYEHNISRIMKLVGMDIEDLGAEPVSSRDQFDVLIEYIAGSEQIPQRILLGSERGELASSQDQANWYKYIDRRRLNRAEPYILRSFIKMGQELGIFDFEIPDDYKVYWPPLFQLTELEEAQEFNTIASAVNTISGGMPDMIIPPDEVRALMPGKYRKVLTPKEISEIEQKKAEADKKNQQPPQPPNGQKPAIPIQQQKLNAMIKALNGHRVHGWLNSGTDVVKPMVWFNVDGIGDYSTMVAFLIPDNLRQILKREYPFIQDDVLRDLHITLCYIGDIRSLDKERIFNAVGQFAAIAHPIKVKMQGIARFNSEMEKDPIVATFDSMGNELVDLRKLLTDILKENGIPYHDNHGYIPHMTLAYIPKEQAIPVDNLDPMEMNFSSVYVVIGQEKTEFPLGVPVFNPIPVAVEPEADNVLDPYGERFDTFDPEKAEQEKRLTGKINKKKK